MKRILNAVALAAAVYTGMGAAMAQDLCPIFQRTIVTPVVVKQACPTLACPDIMCGPSEVGVREAELRQRILNALACGRISQCEADALLSAMDKVAAQKALFGKDGCISYTESRILY